MPYASTVFRLGMRYKNASAISSCAPTYQTYGLPTTDTILLIFPPRSAILSASGESSPSRWTLRYPAAIFRVGFNLEPAIHWTQIVFVAFVPITTIGISCRLVSLLVLCGSMGGK